MKWLCISYILVFPILFDKRSSLALHDSKDTRMQYRELHPWHVSVTEARRIQERLRRHIQVGTYVRDIRYIAGADIALRTLHPPYTLA